jgi:pimeloyl-ACP methyl ester carboxylesterase
MTRLSTVGLFALLSLAMLVAGGAPASATGPSADTLRTDGASEVRYIYVRPPHKSTSAGPFQVVVALHGMGGNGQEFADALASEADEYGWLIVAPTINYRDWTDPDQITHEDPALVAWLSDEIRHLPDRVGYAVRPEVLLFGHSRGAQLSLRLTEIDPEEVAGVAAVSAGTYTLPEAEDPRGDPLDFPYGVANLARDDGGRTFDQTAFDRVPLWIAVGGDDNNPADVPAAWNAYLGTDRVTRAETFTRALESQGANVSLQVFPNVDHTLTDDMRQAGSRALEADITR